jgi:hypothetical protein
MSSITRRSFATLALANLNFKDREFAHLNA